MLTLTASRSRRVERELTSTRTSCRGSSSRPRSASWPWPRRRSTVRRSSSMPCPRRSVREVSGWVAPRRPAAALQLSLAKGLELHTLLRPTEVIAQETSAAAAALSGPNHAEEISRDMPAATVIAARDGGLARRLQEIVTGDTLRVYTNDDVVGVEFCGAAKNPDRHRRRHRRRPGLRRQHAGGAHDAQPGRGGAPRHAPRRRLRHLRRPGRHRRPHGHLHLGPQPQPPGGRADRPRRGRAAGSRRSSARWSRASPRPTRCTT